MAVAQGINKKVAIIKQSALGVPGAGAGGQLLRRVTFQGTNDQDVYENNEIVSHQQSTGAVHGVEKPNAKLNGLVSPSTYKLLMAGLLRKDFVTGVNSTALVNVTAAATTGVQGTFTRAAGSWITDGFKLFDIIRWGGWATTGVPNNAVNMMIIALTATVMTVTRFDTTVIGPKAAGDSVTATVVGKKTFAANTAHTNDYFTIEEWYSDLSKSELWTDCKPAKADIALPATGNATANFDIVGLARGEGVSQVLTTPTAETTTNPLTAIAGFLWLNGAAYTITGGQLTIDGSTSAGEAEVGSNSSSDLQRGRIKVSGSITALFKDTVVQAIYTAKSVVSLVFILLDSTAATSSFVTYVMPAVKIFGDAPDDGEKQIVRSYPFTAQYNGSGGAGTNTDQSILSHQDSDA